MAINKQIQSAIQTIVNRAIEIAPFNKTRTGTILAVNNNGTYKVLIDGIEYPNVPIRKNHIVEVGDVVKVVYPMNNASRMCIDDGYVNKTKTLTIGGDVIIELSDGVTITDTGSAISVTKTGTEDTDDYLLAKAIADTFDYATAKEILEV